MRVWEREGIRFGYKGRRSTQERAGAGHLAQSKFHFRSIKVPDRIGTITWKRASRRKDTTTVEEQPSINNSIQFNSIGSLIMAGYNTGRDDYYSTSSSGSGPKPDPSYHRWNFVAYTANFVVTYGIGRGGLEEYGIPSNEATSRKYQTLITPAGWTFAIWGPIFVCELYWVLWQQMSEHVHRVRCVRWNFVGVCITQMSWSICFALEWIPASMICMLGVLYYLFRSVMALRGRRAQSSREDTPSSYFLWTFPLTLHCAWIIVATAVNWSVVLVWFDVDESVQHMTCLVSLFLLLSVSIWTLTLRPGADMTYAVVTIWACLGIYASTSRPKYAVIKSYDTKQIQTIRLGAVVIATILTACMMSKACITVKDIVQAVKEEEQEIQRKDR